MRSEAGNAMWLWGCRIGADLMSLAVFLIVSRQFGPHGLGVYAYGFAIAGLIYYATTLGIDEYGIREYTRRTPEGRARLIAELLGAQICVSALALLVLSVYLLLTQPQPATLEVVLLLSVYQLGCAFSTTLFVPTMAEQKMASPAVITLMCRAVAASIVIVLVWAGDSLETALSGFAIAGVLLVVLAGRSARSHGTTVRPHVSMSVLRDSARTLWSFAAVDVLGQLFTRIGVIVLSLQIGDAAAGIYATGLKLVETICMSLSFLGLAAYPRLCLAFSNPPEFGKLARQLFWVGAAVAAVSALALYVSVPYLLVPVFGSQYTGAEPVIAAMAALVFAAGMEMVLGRLLLAANLQVMRAAQLSVGAVVCVAVTLATTWRFGIEGVVAAVVLAYVLVDSLYALSLRAVFKRQRTPSNALPVLDNL